MDRGEKLLSNELLYSKKLAGISTRVLINSSSHIKDLRKLTSELRNPLVVEEFIMNKNKILSHRKNERKTQNYRISLKPIVTNARKLSVITEELIVDRILKEATQNLDTLRRNSVLTDKLLSNKLILIEE